MKNNVFFKANISEVKEVFEVPGIEKFKIDGKVIPWEIKKLTTNRTNELAELCKSRELKKGKKVTNFDEVKYNNLLMAESIAFPDLKDLELQKDYECSDNVELMLKLLDIAADYAKMLTSFNIINGFDDEEVKETIETSKN